MARVFVRKNLKRDHRYIWVVQNDGSTFAVNLDSGYITDSTFGSLKKLKAQEDLKEV